ncbi:MAG TPA: hypothetical protein VE261_06910 [Gaiellaceae bacterium]|jgi:hypothetical protein|nr:hypothetical protein [Gaiellaceae bacterium]
MSTRWGDDAATQRHYPRTVQLAQLLTSSNPPAANYTYFRVPVIDARLRVKISLMFVVGGGTPFETDYTGFADLWLYEADDLPDEQGSGRSFGLMNVEGTKAAPTAVPSAAPLLGYSRELQSAADYIEGRFRILTNLALGAWILATRYQPAPGQRFTVDEWQQITALANPTIFNTPKLVI